MRDFYQDMIRRDQDFPVSKCQSQDTNPGLVLHNPGYYAEPFLSLVPREAGRWLGSRMVRHSGGHGVQMSRDNVDTAPVSRCPCDSRAPQGSPGRRQSEIMQQQD